MSTTEDELALDRLMARYIDAVHRRDAQAWAATWAPDGCWNLMGQEVIGRDHIAALWQQMMGGFEFVLMLPSSSMYDIKGDEASGHWYLQEFTRDSKGEATCLVSRYLDSYRRLDGAWVYQARRYDPIYQGPPDLSGAYTAPQ
jgi:ketosteroid isomerase-like protein